MGSWVTLHLIDENKLYNEVIPSLKNDSKEFRDNVIQYLRLFNTGGIGYMDEDQLQKVISETSSNILQTANDFNSSFTRNIRIDSLDIHKREKNINNDLKYYDFGRFFEYLVFRTCVDFFPHIPLGKSGLYRIHTSNINSLVDSIVNEYQERAYIYSQDCMGIEYWISIEDTALLYHCTEELKEIKDDQAVEGIINFLKIAYDNKLGLVVGRDLREYQLERLPQYKIIPKSKWNEYKPNGRVLFER